MATANDFTITLPGVTANATSESPLATLLRRRSYLDPMSQSMWDADPRNQAEIARLRSEEAGLPPGATTPNDQTTFADIFGPPPEPPPGTDTTAKLVSWLGTLTPAKRSQWSTSPRTAGQIRALGEEGYSIDPNGNLITPAAPPPPATPPRAPGAPTGSATVPGSAWNNPESEAPRGYNPELWAQREIGPNRTYSGGVTGMGIGGPTKADGTAMYTPPAEVKPTRGIDPMGYEPAPRKPAEFSGFTIGDDGFYKSDRGGSDSAYDENLLTTLKAAADAGEGRANYILSALSTGADMARPVYSAQMNQYGANPIDNYAAQYDWEQEVLGRKEQQRKLRQGWTLGENRQLVPPSGWVEDDNGGWRPPVGDAGWTQVGNGGRWVKTENTSTEPEGSDMGKPDKKSRNPFMNRMARGSVGISRGRNDLDRNAVQNPPMNPFTAAFTNPIPNPQQRTVPVPGIPISPAQGRLPERVPHPGIPISPEQRRLPVMTMPSQNFPMPEQRFPVFSRPSEPMPVPIQRRPVLIGQPYASEAEMDAYNAAKKAKLEREALGAPIPGQPYVDNSRPALDPTVMYRGGSPGWYSNPRNNGRANPFLMDPQRRPVPTSQPHGGDGVYHRGPGSMGMPDYRYIPGVTAPPDVGNSRPNPFLMGGANRVSGNPFR